MARCDVCGNDYDKTFRVVGVDRAGVFDSFECAIHAMAPICTHCRCHIIGHGVEVDDHIFCGAHCAKKHGATGVRDRV